MKRKHYKKIYIASLFTIIIIIIGGIYIVHRIDIESNKSETYEDDKSVKSYIDQMYNVQSDYSDYTLENNAKYLKTGIENLNNLSYETKEQVLETIGYSELNYLGVNDVEIVFDSLPDGTIGNTNSKSRVITINTDFLEMDLNQEEEMQLVKAPIHEARHMYQGDLINIYINSSPSERNMIVFRECTAWLAGALTYKSPNKYGEGYYLDYRNNQLEKDAENWADERYEFILNELRKYK